MDQEVSSMEQNGSSEPIFETDLACTYFLTILPAKLNDVQEIVAENEGANRNEGANGLLIEGVNNNEGPANGLNAVLIAAFKESNVNQRIKMEPLRQLKKVGLVCFSDKSTKAGGYFITEQLRNALLK